jgi:hypothetical protein
MVKVFGIRHHGPGSTRRLVTALTAFAPDHILLEGPIEANKTIEDMDFDSVDCPVALAGIDSKTNKASGFYPFADFSPEWQAMVYARKNDLDLHFIDLPLHHPGFYDRTDQYDPLQKLARFSGYEDTEAWWDFHFEQYSTEDIFDVIIELIREIRSDEASVREAFMCQNIARFAKKNKKVAVVCGAWHAPVLDDWKKNVPKEKIQASKRSAFYWVPWTYRQLAAASGYGAGVHAPLYYDHLWRYGEKAAEQWFVSAGRSFRDEGFTVSPSHLIEASRMSKTLATMRNRVSPGLPELWDSIESVFPKVDQVRWDHFRDLVWVGKKRGHVPPEINNLPMVTHFHQQVRHFRLGAYLEGEKTEVKHLDLRKDFHYEMSTFFYHLHAMEIPWPILTSGEVAHQGTFNEYWDLNVDFGLDSVLIENAFRGSTIQDGALDALKERIEKAEDIDSAHTVLNLVLRSGFDHLLPGLILKAREVALTEADGVAMLRSITQLQRSIAFGDFRHYDTQALQELRDFLVQRLYLCLVPSLAMVDDDHEQGACASIRTFHASHLYEENTWRMTLDQASQTGSISPLIRGLCFRLYCDMIDVKDEIARQLKLEFSGLDDLQKIAAWLEGFLSTGKLDFIRDEEILDALDEWVKRLNEDQFDDLLVGLRQAFSSFQPQQKNQLWDAIILGKRKEDKTSSGTHDPRFREIYLRLLGLE